MEGFDLVDLVRWVRLAVLAVQVVAVRAEVLEWFIVGHAQRKIDLFGETHFEKHRFRADETFYPGRLVGPRIVGDH